MRHPLKIKQQIQNDISLGISINNISKTRSIAKTTIYYYYKKIKGKRYAQVNIQPTFSEREGEIVGIFAGDGSQHFDKKKGNYQVNIHFGLQNRIYAEHVRELFRNFFQKKFRLQEEGTKLRLRTESKNIYDYFHHYLDFNPHKKHCTVKLSQKKFTKAFKIGFIRGLIDTDGTIIYMKDRGKVRIQFYTTSKVLNEQFCHMLSELGIDCGSYCISRPEYKPLYTIQIRQRDICKFLETIKPFKQKSLNIEK